MEQDTQPASQVQAETSIDLNAVTFRCARSITERILKIAFKHQDQHWLDYPGTDSEKLGKIVGEVRDLLELLDTAVAK